MTSNTAPSASNRRKIPVIGIVGGIGSGKSAVAKWVAARTNVAILDADVIGHEALRDAMVKASLYRSFGEQIRDNNGEINRSALARQVFGPTEEHREARHALEQIVHPEIGRRIALDIEAATAAGREAVLLDAAVLLEAGWKDQCDALVYIDCPDAVRLARVLEHRGWSEDELKRRESSQWTLTEKRRNADWIVTNDGALEPAGQQLLDVLISSGMIRGQ